MADCITLNDVRVPGRTLFNKLKTSKLTFRDSTFGDGDDDFTVQDFVVNNNEIRKATSKVKGDRKIDNR